jgi:acetyl-CoA synthetase
VLRGGEVATTELEAAMIRAVGEGAGSSFRPERVLFVPDLPRTRNMKVMRRVVRSAVIGGAPGDVSSLVNPEVIDEIRRAATAVQAAV